MTIGQLAKRINISSATIRYYEKRQLIPLSTRSKGGHRLYAETIIPFLHFIQNAKRAGFTLEEIETLLTIQQNKGSSASVRDYVVIKLKTIQEKIQSLQIIQNFLTDLVNSCDGTSPLDNCPILQSLKNTPFTDVIEEKPS